MKKTAIITLIASALLFTSCQDAIYEAIREDVQPEEATVSGTITSITRYTAATADGSEEEFLVLAADGGLRYKQKDKSSHGEWRNYSSPAASHSYDFDSSSHTGEQILKVMANDTYLYVISSVYNSSSIPSNIKLWGKKITATGDSLDSDRDWKLIADSTSGLFSITYNSSSYESLFHTFQTNAPQKANRRAFIRAYRTTEESPDEKSYHYYELKDLEMPSEITIASANVVDPNASSDEGYKPVLDSAVYFGGKTLFFTTAVSTTNETYSDPATYFYYTNGGNQLYYSNGSDKTGSITTASDFTVSALATTADSILIGYGHWSTGYAGGIDRAPLTNGVPAGLGSFDGISNAQFQITRSYMVSALLNATPSETEKNSSLYAGVTFGGSSYNFDNIGLWSYYPARGNWNRE